MVAGEPTHRELGRAARRAPRSHAGHAVDGLLHRLIAAHLDRLGVDRIDRRGCIAKVQAKAACCRCLLVQLVLVTTDDNALHGRRVFGRYGGGAVHRRSCSRTLCAHQRTECGCGRSQNHRLPRSIRSHDASSSESRGKRNDSNSTLGSQKAMRTLRSITNSLHSSSGRQRLPTSGIIVISR